MKNLAILSGKTAVPSERDLFKVLYREHLNLQHVFGMWHSTADLAKVLEHVRSQPKDTVVVVAPEFLEEYREGEKALMGAFKRAGLPEKRMVIVRRLGELPSVSFHMDEIVPTLYQAVVKAADS